jgi:hypothetical protein
MRLPLIAADVTPPAEIRTRFRDQSQQWASEARATIQVQICDVAMVRTYDDA